MGVFGYYTMKQGSNKKKIYGWIGVLMLPVSFALYVFGGLALRATNLSEGMSVLSNALNALIFITSFVGFFALPVGVIFLVQAYRK